jgi:hypothetical protein
MFRYPDITRTSLGHHLEVIRSLRMKFPSLGHHNGIRDENTVSYCPISIIIELNPVRTWLVSAECSKPFFT